MRIRSKRGQIATGFTWVPAMIAISIMILIFLPSVFLVSQKSSFEFFGKEQKKSLPPNILETAEKFLFFLNTPKEGKTIHNIILDSGRKVEELNFVWKQAGEYFAGTLLYSLIFDNYGKDSLCDPVLHKNHLFLSVLSGDKEIKFCFGWKENE